MPRIHPIDPAAADGPAADLFSAIKARKGLVPNLMRTLGHSPAALKGYLDLSSALSAGILPAGVREQLALAIAQVNRCDYCLAAHSRIGRGLGLSPEVILDARRARAADPKTDALLKFATALVEQRGLVADRALAEVRAAGATDSELMETVVHVALNILTNYVNHVAQTEVDFPRVLGAVALEESDHSGAGNPGRGS